MDQEKLEKLIIRFFEGRADESEIKMLRGWAEESPEHKEFIRNLYIVWLNGESYLEAHIDADKDWKILRGKIRKQTIKKVSLTCMKYAAVILLTFGLGIIGIKIATDESPERTEDIVIERSVNTPKVILVQGDGEMVYTDSQVDTLLKSTTAGIFPEDTPTDIRWNKLIVTKGGEYKIELPDGTRVWINAETELIFPDRFTANKREVELHGEAYFEVAENRNAPFIVKTDSVSVKVLGTSFNLRSYIDENSVTTTLVKGKVELINNDRHFRLTPGEQAKFSKEDAGIDIRRVDISLYTAWHTGKFIFRNEKLEDVMAYLSRWYGFKYEFLDQDSRKIKIGASLNKYENMTPIIEMMRKTDLVQLEWRDDTLRISERI